jgi:outer membrane scaffolding protein for murein synthesis (MipA/OmpV family)
MTRYRRAARRHRLLRNLRATAAALLAIFATAGTARAQTTTAATPEIGLDGTPTRKASWEAGFVAGGGRLADYPGSDQSHVRGLVAPVLFYRGPVLSIDQSGVRGRVFDSPDFEFELTATGAFDAHNNSARDGMPDLDYLFGLGPQLVYKGLRGVPGQPTLHLKLRALMSTDFHRLDSRGYTFNPELRWRLRPFSDPLTRLTFSLEPTWASRALTRYFYEIDASQATATRPAYAARAGYIGSEAMLTLSRRHGREFSWFVSARAMSLHGAANADSPLLKSKTNFDFGAGVVWTPWRSEGAWAD